MRTQLRMAGLFATRQPRDNGKINLRFFIVPPPDRNGIKRFTLYAAQQHALLGTGP